MNKIFDPQTGWVRPVLTAHEARLLIDHLDNVQASSLDDPEWRVFREAKRKLLIMEAVAEKSEGTTIRDNVFRTSG